MTNPPLGESLFIVYSHLFTLVQSGRRQAAPPLNITMQRTSNRLPFLDALKAIASQLIVLHHLAFYGPMSDTANVLAPELFSWFSQNARIAVQLFLVIGGFLAARGLAPSGEIVVEQPLRVLKKRYFKLVIPYAAALVLSVACSSIARGLMIHDSIPGKPSALQVLAHVTLLQGIFQVDSLSTGVWYIAIDFQLFAVLLGILWLIHHVGARGRVARLLGVSFVTVLTLSSLFHFNRLPSWDDWAIYFFGAYGLGVLTYWISVSRNRTAWMAALIAVTVIALAVNFRPRIAVAIATAVAIWGADASGLMETFPRGAVLGYLGKISYSVFLSHFPVLLVINALVNHYAPENPIANGIGVLAGWLASVLMGMLFYHLVESRAGLFLERSARLASKCRHLFVPPIRADR